MAADDLKRVHGHVAGRVQGVWYRGAAQEAARALGLRGWVRNLPDGRVEFAAQGPARAVDSFLAWARQGPPAANVGELTVEDEEPTTANGGFEVLY